MFDFAGARVEEAEVFSEDDGDVDARVGVEQGFGDAADVGELRGGEVENFEGIVGSVGRERGKLGEGGIHRESSFDDFFRRQSLLEHGVTSVGVGDDPGVGRRVDPGGVNLDGVGDDGDDGRWVRPIGEDAIEEVGVDRVGGDDGVRLKLIDEGGEFVFRLAHEWDPLAGEVDFSGGIVDLIPEMGRVGGDPAVAFAQRLGGDGSTEKAGVGDARGDA